VPRQYTHDEMEAIVRRALERQGRGDGIDHGDLLAAAAEIGIPADEVEAAAEEVELERDRQRWAESARTRRRGRFWSQLTAMVGLNGLLFTIDALTGGGWWFHWVLMGTGVPMSLQALRLYRPVEQREVERERRREEREQRRRARALRRKRRQRSPSEDFEVIVERGVELLMDAISNRADGAARGRHAGSAPHGHARVRVDPRAGDELGEDGEGARQGRSRDHRS
jgi:hypothetical protein